MTATTAGISNRLLSLFAGLSAFALTLLGFVLLGTFGEQVAASLLLGIFALIVVRAAAERPNSAQSRAMAALRERLLAVRSGDLSSPAPAVLEREMPALAGAVNGLFEQVRSTLDDANALAMYDPVTALPNRIHFRREAERLLKCLMPDLGAAILFVDLDGFKEVNDRLGHAQGDQALIMVADRLRLVVKAEIDPEAPWSPILARLAGDEFTLFLPGIGQKEAERIAARALDALSEPFRPGESLACLGGSIGIALAPAHGIALPDLMKAADLAMYQAKAAGRSCFRTYAPALGEAAAERSRGERALREALRRGAVDLVFQPETCLAGSSLIAAEARICARGDDGALRPIDEELRALGEDSGLSIEYGEWKVGALARALGRSHSSEARLSIDIHPRQLAAGRLEPILDRLDAAGALIAPVELRLSEKAAMRLDEAGLARLHALRARGIGIALDDFGKQGCGFERLRALPLDRIKFDAALAAAIDRDEAAAAAFAALIHLVHGFGCTAIAKGVSRASQIAVLRAIGCDGIQGPLCGEAIGEAELRRWNAPAPLAPSIHGFDRLSRYSG
jgi:diguanylate cyclase (GGDEF)-like protein